ncbi:MAG: head GIN domain-containing protein [Sphingomicrobium sp.]
MRKSIAAAVIAASAATSACGHDRGEGPGPTVSRNYQVGNFQVIEVAGPYDVQVRTGSNPSVSARGSEKLLERTVVEVRGDKLIIHPREHNGWFHFGWSTRGEASFTITVPMLNGATIAGSGDVQVDRVQGDHFEGKVAGSGGIVVGNMDVQSLKLAIAGSGGVKGAGKAKSAVYEIAGSGGIDGQGILAEQAKISIAGSGDVKAHASGTADVSIMGSGDVDVSGGAKCNVSKAGSGNVRCS